MLKILYEDAAIVAVEKPVGVPSEPVNGNGMTVRLAAQQGAAVLALQGGDPARMPGDLPALLHRCGAYVTATGSGPWAAAVRLPLSPTLPLREPPAPADLVLDRYSAAKVYLDGLCVEDEE